MALKLALDSIVVFLDLIWIQMFDPDACLIENRFHLLRVQARAYDRALQMSVNFPDRLYVGILILLIFIK